MSEEETKPIQMEEQNESVEETVNAPVDVEQTVDVTAEVKDEEKPVEEAPEKASEAPKSKRKGSAFDPSVLPESDDPEEIRKQVRTWCPLQAENPPN